MLSTGQSWRSCRRQRTATFDIVYDDGIGIACHALYCQCSIGNNGATAITPLSSGRIAFLRRKRRKKKERKLGDYIFFEKKNRVLSVYNSYLGACNPFSLAKPSLAVVTVTLRSKMPPLTNTTPHSKSLRITLASLFCRNISPPIHIVVLPVPPSLVYSMS